MASRQPDPDELFVKLRMLPIEQQATYLAELTDDDDVRQLVQDLLKADSAADDEQWLEYSPLARRDDTGVSRTVTAAKQRPAVSLKDTPEEVHPEEVGRYKIQELVGAGTFASVYRAFDPHLGIELALKVSKQPLPESERAAFLKEAQRLFPLQHRNVVRVYNADVADDGRAFIAMEYVAGATLLDHLKEYGPLEISEAATIMVGIADAMGEAHKTMVHRDLKPANILIDECGNAKVGDFGLAILDDEPRHRGEYAGTTPYMSPEQIRCESDNLHGSSDRWAMGVILYEMLTGSRPFDGDLGDIKRAIKSKTPKPPRELRSDIPVAIEAICLRCLSKDPAERPTSAFDISKILRRHVTRPKRRKRIAMVTAASILACVFGITLAITRPWENNSGSRNAARQTDSNPIRELLWSVGWEITSDGTALELKCTPGSNGLLLFGEANERSYELEYEFNQTPLSGGFGIVLGYRDPDYHVLMFRKLKGRLYVTHSRSDVLEGGFDRIKGVHLPIEDDLQNVRCTMFIHRNRLSRVKVNGQDLTELYKGHESLGYRGEFGVYVMGKSVTIPSVKYQQRPIQFERR